jgi:hypothetical protein
MRASVAFATHTSCGGGAVVATAGEFGTREVIGNVLATLDPTARWHGRVGAGVDAGALFAAPGGSLA